MQNQQEQVVLKYELTQGAVQFLQLVLDKVEMSGIQNHQNVLMLVGILNKPVNANELEKAQFDAMKAKFEPKQEEKADKPAETNMTKV